MVRTKEAGFYKESNSISTSGRQMSLAIANWKMKTNYKRQPYQDSSFMMQSPRSSSTQIKPKSSAIHIILATLLIPVPIRSSAEAHSALNIVRDRGLWQWAVVATTVVAFKMASALRKHLWRGGLLPSQWPPLFVLDRAKLGTQKLTQWHRIDVHLWHFISYRVSSWGWKVCHRFWGTYILEFRGDVLWIWGRLSSLYGELIIVALFSAYFCIFSNYVRRFDASKYEKKAVWPGSLYKKTCRRRRLFQHPRKKKAFACYSKAERRGLIMRARASIKARMCSISKIFSPLAITMVFAIKRWKKFDEGKYFAIGKVCLLHIFFAHFSNA